MKVVSLDFGGTLAYEPKEEYLTYHQLLASIGYMVKQEDVKKAYEKTVTYFREGGIFGKRVWDESLHLEFIILLCRNLMIEDAEVVARRVHELFPYELDVRKFDDVDKALSVVKEYGARLIVISNIASEMRLRIYLDRLEIADYFDYLIASGSVGFEKPDTRIFRHAASLVGVEPQSIMHVGDSYEHDYLGAQAAGLFPVLIDRYGRNKDKNCRKIDKLYMLVNFLQEAL